MMSMLADEKDRYVSAWRERRVEAMPAWLAAIQREAIGRFERTGFPTTRVEAWKYTDVAPLLRLAFGHATGSLDKLSFSGFERLRAPEAEGACLVFVDGMFHRELSSTRDVDGGVVVADLGTAVVEHAEAVAGSLGSLTAGGATPFGELNLAMTSDGPFVFVPRGCAFSKPIHIVYLSGSANEPVASHPRALVVAGESSRFSVIETFASVNGVPAMTNAVAEFIVGANAEVDHVRVQREGERTYHIGATKARVARDGRYSSCAIAIGGALSRHDLSVELAEQGASCRVDGLYIGEGTQHLDNHTRIDHLVPHGTSSQLYKGVLDDDARAVFNGQVVVHHAAQKTEAHQTNRNLVLSPRARVDTKPELEIFADDVICSHGATVGALEAEEQFYLASRGLDESTARALLTYGFAEEVIGEIRVESVRRHLDEVILGRFQKGLSIG